MELLFGVVIGIFVLVLLVTVHELGHAIAARRNGVIVEEFGVGFPPRAWAKKLKNGVLFSLNWLPLGGFVKLKGEHDSASKPGDYGAASFWQKTKILLAGVMMNWLVAAFLLTILAWAGLPKALDNQFTMPGDTTITQSPVEVAKVIKDSAADRAGLKVGDQILRFAGESVPTPETLVEKTKQSKGKSVEIIYSRGGVESNVMASLPTENENGKGYLGVTPDQQKHIKATWSAPIVGVVTTAQLTGATFQGIGNMVGNLVGGIVLQFSGDPAVRQAASQNLAAASGSVAGPIGILGTIFPSAEQAGLTQLIWLSAVLSLTLAVMNVLPIPALDGGRWFTMAVFRILKKPLTKEREEKIQGTGFMILMLLVVLVTIADVAKLFH